MTCFHRAPRLTVVETAPVPEPTWCPVCSNDRQALLLILGLRGSGLVRCPACNPEPGRSRIPIGVPVRGIRRDRPSGDAA